jgi:4-nitrophenol 2-monooxygenase / 4-nitrocatechol 4-monooxygenase, reductase component
MTRQTVASGEPTAACDEELYRRVIGHFASGVAVITTRTRERRFGMTASAVTSLSLDPPMLLVCINRRAPTCAAVSETGLFGVNVLTEDQGEVAERFARPSEDKFAGLAVEESDAGLPLLSDTLARLECRVVEEVAGGTHSVFLAEALRAEAGSGLPLTYYRGRFGRLELVEDDAVYDELRRRVLGGQFAEDDQLEVGEIAGELRTQPWHVYHALTRLTAEGIVVRDAQAGYMIAPVDLRTIEDSLDGRRAIEIGAVELSVERTTEEELAELRRLMERTLPLIADCRFVDVDEYAAANAAFHEYIVGLARSDALLHAYRRLGLPGILARSLHTSNVAPDELTLDHLELVEAFEDRDVERAKDVVGRHTERSKLTHRLAFEQAQEQFTSRRPGEMRT